MPLLNIIILSLFFSSTWVVCTCPLTLESHNNAALHCVWPLKSIQNIPSNGCVLDFTYHLFRIFSTAFKSTLWPTLIQYSLSERPLCTQRRKWDHQIFCSFCLCTSSCNIMQGALDCSCMKERSKPSVACAGLKTQSCTHKFLPACTSAACVSVNCRWWSVTDVSGPEDWCLGKCIYI